MTKHYDIDATREDRELVKIIELHNNTLVGDWRCFTRVTHQRGGKITVHYGGKPAEGWQAWLDRKSLEPAPAGARHRSPEERAALAQRYESEFIRHCTGSS